MLARAKVGTSDSIVVVARQHSTFDLNPWPRVKCCVIRAGVRAMARGEDSHITSGHRRRHITIPRAIERVQELFRDFLRMKRKALDPFYRRAGSISMSKGGSILVSVEVLCNSFVTV